MADWHDVAGRPVRSLVLGAPRPEVPELVVAPGLGALGYLRPTLEQCARWTRVTLLDLPGFGSWRTALLPADLPTVADLIAGWLRQVPAGPVLLFGHSTGAQAALHAALHVPDRLASLVLGGVTFPPEARRLVPLVRSIVRTLPAEQWGELPAVLPEYVRGAVRVPQFLLTSLADRPEQSAPQLQVPLLVLRGAKDALCPSPWADRLAALAPQGTALTVPGGHNFVWTHPVETSAALGSVVA